jgi:CxxC motif-containing protein (DUF1111 family)
MLSRSGRLLWLVPDSNAFMVQADASDQDIGHAAADAAEAAFDKVANAELAYRQSTQGGKAAAAFAVSDAVLHQRTYFVPTMVSHCRPCHDANAGVWSPLKWHDLS